MTRVLRAAGVRAFLVTDASRSDDEVVAAARRALGILPPAKVAIQLRDKVRSLTDLAPLARTLRAVTSACGTSFVVGDHPDLARDVGADGVHVPGGVDAVAAARDTVGPDVLISAPCHADEDVLPLAGAGATSLLVSPIFATPGKGPARGLGAVTRARDALASVVVPVRVTALGGVDESNAEAAFAAGAGAIAFVRPWFAEDAVGRLGKLAAILG
ncbi:MAG: thiamine phosphate synthase [Polyangiaceae bacterium]